MATSCRVNFLVCRVRELTVPDPPLTTCMVVHERAKPFCIAIGNIVHHDVFVRRVKAVTVVELLATFFIRLVAGAAGADLAHTGLPL